jgi:hypothetical protein
MILHVLLAICFPQGGHGQEEGSDQPKFPNVQRLDASGYCSRNCISRVRGTLQVLPILTAGILPLRIQPFTVLTFTLSKPATSPARMYSSADLEDSAVLDCLALWRFFFAIWCQEFTGE